VFDDLPLTSWTSSIPTRDPARFLRDFG